MTRIIPFLVLVAVVIGIAATPTIDCADSSKNLPGIPSGGRSLLPGDPLRAIFGFPPRDPGLAETRIIEVRGMPFREAIRTRTFKQPARPWDVLIGIRLSGDIDKGDACLLSFSVRATGTDSQKHRAMAHAYIEFSKSPNDKLLLYPVCAAAEWHTFYLPFQAPERLSEGSVQVVLHLGFHPQDIEVGGLSMVNYARTRALADLPRTPITYEGREDGAAWRTQALERIDQVRKGPLAVEVVDSEGKPVEGAKIHIQMLRHAFGFGSAVAANLLGVNLEDTETVRDYFPHYGSPRNIRIYRQFIEKLFNKAVFDNDLKFIPWMVSKTNLDDTYRKEWTDRAFAWLHERGILVRGHWVACGDLTNYPKELVYGSKDLFRSLVFESVRDKLPAVGNRVSEWDAVNHLVGGENNLAANLGSPDPYVEIMKLSRELAPGIELWVNEGSVLAEGLRRDPYEKLIRHLIEQNAAPDGIGFMGHFDILSLTPPEETMHVMDRFARIIPNIQITELDVDVGDDEQLQADYFRDVMIAAFSHPACKGIMIWGFWEKSHWKPAAALYRSDWSIKPAGRVWEDLVFHRWWTDGEGLTDTQGCYAVRGFLGQYQVTATWRGKRGSKKVKLPKAGAQVRIVLQ